MGIPIQSSARVWEMNDSALLQKGTGKSDSAHMAEKDLWNARMGGVPRGSVPCVREAAERTERLLREFKYEAARCFNFS
jgi:hypothetical protein